MSRPDEKLREFETLWETLALDETAGLEEGQTATMRPDISLDDGGDSRDLSRLPELMGAARGRVWPEVELKGLIGRGGMGEVALARQVPLARDVAVKSLRPDTRGSSATLVLLRESWITGRLEHPNIVPVYTLGRDEAGEPMIVMKKIEGVSWAELMRDPACSPRVFDSDDPLDWHFEILIQVCNAVHYAHSKGIIHRDIKPDNVMIGEFGEVYLLDWGIAVSLEEDTERRLPDVSQVTSPAGTPAYMAPEMVSGDGQALCVQSDVYLLGAVLHQILTGDPPHQGDTLFQIMFAAYTAEPREYAEAIHPELASICRRAMHPEPSQRFASAEAFRQALAHHMGHRDSLRISETAAARLERLRQMLAQQSSADADSDQQLYKIFGECRFGFEQALEVSPDNDQARRGLQSCLELMAARELDRHAYRAAALLVADLPEPNAQLEQRLAEVSAHLDSRERQLEDLKRIQYEEDIDVSSRSRGLVAVAMGTIWGLLSIVAPALAGELGIAITPSSYLAHSGLIVLSVLIPVGLKRRALLENAANRRMVGAFLCLLGGGIAMRMVTFLLDLPVSAGVAFETALYGWGGGIVAVALDRRVLPAALAYGACSILMALVPAYVFPLFGLASLVGMGGVAWKWSRGEAAQPAADG